MTYFESIVMGAFQGFSEFLPISSSGHLAILQALFGIKEGNLFLAEMLHLGTLLSVFVVYFNDIKLMIIEFFKLLGKLLKREKIRINRYQKMALMIILATIPTVITALLFKDLVDDLFKNTILVAIAFIITGFLLWFAQKQYREEKDIRDMKPKDALVIGLMQGVAIIPGISRSGSTIVASLFCGMKKSVATEFSFLLSIPTVLGAAILGFKDLASSNISMNFDMMVALGVLVSFLVGLFSIKILIKVLNKGKLNYFSYYLWILGIIIIIYRLMI